MRLYLSSYKFGDHPAKLALLVCGYRKALVIPNALDFSDNLERRQAGIRRELNTLIDLGLEAEELDLRAYFRDTPGLKKKINNTGLVWVMGGNAFVLRRAMRQSGLDQILIGMRKQDNFVYAGYSAGACVAAPTLRGIDLVDNPDFVPDGYNQEIIWEGLSLVDYCIAPHYRSDHPDSPLIDKTIEYYIENKLQFIALRDGEVVIEE